MPEIDLEELGFMPIPHEERERDAVRRMQEAVEMEDPQGCWVIHDILRDVSLSDRARMRVMEIAAQSHIMEIAEFLSDGDHSEEVMMKGIGLLGSQGVLDATIRHAVLFYKRYGLEVEGPVLEQGRKSAIEAIRLLSGPEGRRYSDEYDPVFVINTFLFTRGEWLGDDAKLEIIKVLAENMCPEPLGNLANGRENSEAVRKTAQHVIGKMDISASYLRAGMDSLRAQIKKGDVKEVLAVKPGPKKVLN